MLKIPKDTNQTTLKNQRKNPLGDMKIEPWNNPEWTDLFNQRGQSAIPVVGLYILMQLLDHCLVLDGDIAEFGVWKGGSAKLLGLRSQGSGKTLHLFDTFAGMPNTSIKDNFWEKGDWHNTSLNEVRIHLKDFQTHFHVGDIVEETKKAPNLSFCFAHLDCDLYEPTLHTSEYLYSRMSKGGIMVYDDYGYMDCAGAKTAVDEFYSTKPETPIFLPGNQCFVIKL